MNWPQHIREGAAALQQARGESIGVAEVGDVVPCVYCKGQVMLDEVEHDAPMQGVDHSNPGGPLVDVNGSWAEGKCDGCGRHVEYDYDPVAEPSVSAVCLRCSCETRREGERGCGCRGQA